MNFVDLLIMGFNICVIHILYRLFMFA